MGLNLIDQRIAIASLALVAMVAGAARAGNGPARPNVLIVFIDDLGWGDLSCYGNRLVATPHLDRLAREGIRFTRFYTASPICSASRCGLITGQFPARWRITSYLQTRAGNQYAEQADFLDPKAPSLPRVLQAAGYTTAHVGKWHLGGGRDVAHAPRFRDYGYELGLGTYESPEPAPALGRTTTPWESRLDPGQVPRHDRTRWMVDQALVFLDTHRDQSWFINLWLDDTHTPYRPSAVQKKAVGPDTAGGEKSPIRANYRAVLAEVDRQVGRLLDGLHARGLDERTLVLVAGDNGPEPTFNRARTGGLRGMKWSLYEGGIRVPFIARWPGTIPAGVVDESSVIGAVDLFPTICALCGIAPPDGITFDGEDMSAPFRGHPTARSRPLFWEYGRKPPPPGAQGLGPFPYPREPGARSPNVAVLEGAWKLLVNADGTGAELYNLRDDPDESHNRAADQPALADRLKARALNWRKSLP